MEKSDWDIMNDKRCKLLNKMYREIANKPDGKLESLDNFDDIISRIIISVTYAYLEDLRTHFYLYSIDELIELMRLEMSGNYAEWKKTRQVLSITERIHDTF